MEVVNNPAQPQIEIREAIRIGSKIAARSSFINDDHSHSMMRSSAGAVQSNGPNVINLAPAPAEEQPLAVGRDKRRVFELCRINRGAQILRLSPFSVPVEADV